MCAVHSTSIRFELPVIRFLLGDAVSVRCSYKSPSARRIVIEVIIYSVIVVGIARIGFIWFSRVRKSSVSVIKVSPGETQTPGEYNIKTTLATREGDVNDAPQVPVFGLIKRHRTRALLNGIVIGLGIGFMHLGDIVFAGIFVAIGLGMEYWHRQREKSSE